MEKLALPSIEAVTEADKTKLKPPPMYLVLLLNDDYTPMDFVVEVLMNFFSMCKEKAIEIMMKVHFQGKAICGQYSRDVAETKVEQVLEYAKRHQHPLQCVMQKG